MAIGRPLGKAAAHRSGEGAAAGWLGLWNRGPRVESSRRRQSPTRTRRGIAVVSRGAARRPPVAPEQARPQASGLGFASAGPGRMGHRGRAAFPFLGYCLLKTCSYRTWATSRAAAPSPGPMPALDIGPLALRSCLVLKKFGFRYCSIFVYLW